MLTGNGAVCCGVPAAPASDPDALPRLTGARARAGVQALADRLAAAGLVARVFGHPARVPANRDAVFAALVGVAAAGVAWVAPSAALWLGGVVLGVAGIAAGGVALWPRRAAWTVVVNAPVPTVRAVHVLALDRRRTVRAFYAVAALPGAALWLSPGSAWPVGVALVAAAICAVDLARPRPIALDAAERWVLERAGRADALVLVTTAGSAHGEGVRAVVDWFGLPGRALQVHLDEDGDSGVVARLGALGIGGGDVVGQRRAGG